MTRMTMMMMMIMTIKIKSPRVTTSHRDNLSQTLKFARQIPIQCSWNLSKATVTTFCNKFCSIKYTCPDLLQEEIQWGLTLTRNYWYPLKSKHFGWSFMGDPIIYYYNCIVIVTGAINTNFREKTLHLTILNFALQSFMSSHWKAV